MERGKYRKTLEKVEIIKEAYKKEGRLTLRRIYYILVSRKKISHSQNSYDNLSKQTVKWRNEGLLDPDIFVDSHRLYIKKTSYRTFQEALDEMCEDFTFDSMLGQSIYTEVWIEKDTMRTIFLEDCYFNDVPL